MIPPLSTDLSLIKKLLDRTRPQVVVVVGAGVACSATNQPHASWRGLLSHGIRHLVQNHFQQKRGNELEVSLRNAFNPFDLRLVLEHAELVERNLSTPDTKAFAQWLESAFADFKANDDDEIKAPLYSLRDIHEAGALLLTTNYDSLLSDITGAPAVTWEEHEDFHRVMTRQKTGILHIHGHWQRPSSIVLGRSSYDRVVADIEFQQLFRTLWLDWSWVYVGCGDGLDDPNLGRLLEWSKTWGKSSLPDFFLARDDKAKEIAACSNKPPNLKIISYPSHEDFPATLRSLTPAARCWPFVRVDDDFHLFHVYGASDPFPTRQEYIDGHVPAFAVDIELRKRLQAHGWACCIDVASVGKTTLALRAATAIEQRTHPVFYLDLKKEIEEDADSSPVTAVSRLARPGTLLILDNVHHQPELARQLWQQWHDKPFDSRGRLLLVATRIHRPVVVTPVHDLMFFERHPENPAMSIRPTPEDLGRIAKHLYRRIGGAKLPPMPEPSAKVLAEWHSIYGAALNAFAFAALDSLANFQKNKWSLLPSRASIWVHEHWLNKLDIEERENTICLATFGAQEIEIHVSAEALPHPGKMEKLFALGLVTQTQRGQLKQYRQYELREPGWGRLILGALSSPIDEEQILFATASRHLHTAMILSERLRRNGKDDRLKRLWDRLAQSADGLINQTSDLPLQAFTNLVKLVEAGGQPELLTHFWNSIEADSHAFAASAWANSLDKLGSFLDVARQHKRDTAPWWALLESQPEKFTASAWVTSLDKLGSFLSVARRHKRDTAPWWALLESQPEKFTASAWATSLDTVGSFLDVARQHGRDTAPWWALLEGQPEKFTASAWANSLEKVGYFLDVARRHGRNTAPLWALLESQPEKFIASAWANSLDKLGSFLGVAWRHKRDTAPWWALLESQPEKFTASAWATSLDTVGSFLDVARQHGRDTAPWWALLEGQPEKFIASAWANSLEKVGYFLDLARQHGRDTAPWWALLEGQPEKFIASAWANSLEKVGYFLDVARRHGRNTAPLWALLESQPEKFTASAWVTSLDKLGSFLSVARRHKRDTAPWWALLESQPDRLSREGQLATLEALVGFAHHAPLYLLKIALLEIKPGHWSSITASEGLVGATWLAWKCANAMRNDLATDLKALLLRRKNWRDFPAQSGGFTQVCWLLANIPASANELVEPFLKTIRTKKWLQIAYAATGCGQLASGLRQLALNQSVNRCQQFNHKGLDRRLEEELGQFESAAPHEQSQIIQFLGCAGLCGWLASQRVLACITIKSLSLLPLSVLPHRPEAKRVEDYQYQLWLGLRVFVGVTRQTLSLDRETISETLLLWRANFAETDSMPTTATHRVNQSMVAWLEICSCADPPALVPPTEPLWTLMGFPRDSHVKPP
ncbi:hypothetical protein RAS2_16690 [Phycisphaerae bacterium RAS2]|nr:hypothetical protein RAS2_16690 [Phycisphaerae bacterium RAS2]